MSDRSPQQLQPHPAVPERGFAGESRPRCEAVPERAGWRYHPRRMAGLWRSKALRAGAVVTVLALSGLVILALVREQTGTEGFLVGLGLAVLPVPLLAAAFRWLDRVEPGPWKNLVFAFSWGAFAAALVAIIANTFATRWIATATADPTSADTLGATVIAPVVEESAKAAAVLLIFLFRRRDFTGIVDGVVVAGFTATGFAFTENILYLGNAFGEDQEFGTSGFESVTAATFFVRIVMSPFAHPLFTVLTGIGFGIAAGAAATGAAGRGRRIRRWGLPSLGLVLAMGVHALWNGSAAAFGPYGFYIVYAGFMVPAFALLTWLAVWTRQRELRTVGARLPEYAAAGWLQPLEPMALSSMRARRVAREYARRAYGPAGTGSAAARTVAEYEGYATALAFLRHRAHQGAAGAEFVAREQELLRCLWERRGVAGPALVHAARVTGRVVWVPAQGYGMGAPVPHQRAPHPGAAYPGAAYPGAPYPYAGYNPYRA
ncbi:PrsW family intramembrane metalloprotease [Streptomyces sp. NPDC050504]|uniref:PrsW family intramembrane metalloprotease n=1 Tax=Streptomyces sp. NPDC050504 TaxID=3365618 RepID=UPI0037A3EB1C